MENINNKKFRRPIIIGIVVTIVIVLGIIGITSSRVGLLDNKNKQSTIEEDYSKYTGTWTNNYDEFIIKKIENNKITFSWYLFRLTGIEDITLDFIDNKAFFYFEGYSDEDFNDNLTKDEKYMKKTTIELKDDTISIVIENVNNIDDRTKILEFGGSKYMETGTYTYTR